MSANLHPSEVALNEALTKKALYEAEAQRHIAKQQHLYAFDKGQKFRDDEASDWRNNVYVFSDVVDTTSVLQCRRTLETWSRQNPDCTMQIIFNSPGGSVFDGWLLFDTIGKLKRSGHHVTTTCLGMAASMAGALMQAGDHRQIGAESFLMLHETSAGHMGKASILRDGAELSQRLTKQMVEIYARRSTLSAEEIEARMTRTDWWVSAEEALEYGFVDAIV